MLYLIPAPLHRLALRVAYRLRNRWWALTRRAGRAATLIAIDAAGRVLLVRHSYGSRRWTVPGGGLGRSEDAEAGVRREMREELGCGLTGVRLAFEVVDVIAGAEQHGYVFVARLDGGPRIDRREILECGWFERGNLPPDTMRMARVRIEQALGGAPAS